MSDDALAAQIAAEQRQIEQAPKVPVRQLQPAGAGSAGRCHWCGRYRTDLQLVQGGNLRDQTERYKGGCCRPVVGD